MHWIPFQEVIIYYLFYQPFCYVMVKVLGYGYEVYWIVYIGISIIMTTINFSYLRCLNLEKIVQEIEERQN